MVDCACVPEDKGCTNGCTENTFAKRGSTAGAQSMVDLGIPSVVSANSSAEIEAVLTKLVQAYQDTTSGMSPCIELDRADGAHFEVCSCEHPAYRDDKDCRLAGPSQRLVTLVAHKGHFGDNRLRSFRISDTGAVNWAPLVDWGENEDVTALDSFALAKKGGGWIYEPENVDPSLVDLLFITPLYNSTGGFVALTSVLLLRSTACC